MSQLSIDVKFESKGKSITYCYSIITGISNEIDYKCMLRDNLYGRLDVWTPNSAGKITKSQFLEMLTHMCEDIPSDKIVFLYKLTTSTVPCHLADVLKWDLKTKQEKWNKDYKKIAGKISRMLDSTYKWE